MKYLLILLTFLAFQSEVQAKNRTKTIWIQSSVPDASLSENETKFSFVVLNAGIYASSKVLYQVDKSGQNVSVQLTNQKMFSHTTGIGSHKFVISAGPKYKEIKARLKGKAGHHVTVIVNFKAKRQKRTRRGRSMRVQPKKPVIYLYPEQETDISVRLELPGELTYTYPAYEDGWDIQASPDGTLKHNGNEYNYLFWESTQNLSTNAVDFTKGAFVEGENLTSFLEVSLTQFGFTSKEMADFITYWAPIMKDNPNLYICFVYNEACDAFAELSVTPQPHVLARFYMLWMPIEKGAFPVSVEPLEIPTIDRSGFVVLEWGGMEINVNTLEEIN
jgi:hypothetical protein